MCEPKDVYATRVHVKFHPAYGVAVTDDNNLLLRGSKSTRDIAAWLDRNGYTWLKGSNGVWVKH